MTFWSFDWATAFRMIAPAPEEKNVGAAGERKKTAAQAQGKCSIASSSSRKPGVCGRALWAAQ